MYNILKDKIAIVTGAAMGNGRGIAKVLADEGATVCLWDISPKVHDTAAEFNKNNYKAAGFEVDITDAERVDKAAQDVINKFGRVDILVNNAGMFPLIDFFKDLTVEKRNKVFELNIYGTINCCKSVLPFMVEQKYGRVINISSVTGPMTMQPGWEMYGATKGAVLAFTKGMAVTLGEYNITMNALLPGTFDTPGLRKYLATLGDPDEQLKDIGNNIPLKRAGLPEDLGGAVTFFASEFSSYITGAELIVDGGNVLPEW